MAEAMACLSSLRERTSAVSERTLVTSSCMVGSGSESGEEIWGLLGAPSPCDVCRAHKVPMMVRPAGGDCGAVAQELREPGGTGCVGLCLKNAESRPGCDIRQTLVCAAGELHPGSRKRATRNQLQRQDEMAPDLAGVPCDQTIQT